MTQTTSKDFRILFGAVLALMLVSWSKFIFTGSLKVDDNPLPQPIGIVTFLVFTTALFLYGRVYYKLYVSANSLTVSHKQLKQLGYLLIIFSSLMLPILSNDIFLYIAYGEVSNRGVDVFSNQHVLRYSQWLPYIGDWKSSPYLYGPTTLWISKLANWIGGNSIVMVLVVFKLIIAIISIGFIEIFSLTVKNNQDFLYVLMIPAFWLQNIAGIHYDLLAAFFLLISVYFIGHQKIVFALIAIALACSTKIVFIIFLPFIIIHYWGLNPERLNVKTTIYFLIGILGFIGMILLAYLPFWNGIETVKVPLSFLNHQEPSKSFSEVLGEILNVLFSKAAPISEIENTAFSTSKLWWWKQCRITFNFIGIGLAVILLGIFMVKTGLKFTRIQLAELWVKLTLIFFFFYSHIFNAWYLVALLPFIPLIGPLDRLKKYIIIVAVYSNLHMIMLNIHRESFIYYLLIPIIFINICLFLWQFRKNFLTIESLSQPIK